MKKHAPYSKLVTITAGSEGESVILDKCLSRRLYARLIDALIPLHPSIIVIDSVYLKSACANNSEKLPNRDQSTSLTPVLQRAVSKKIDLIIGLNTLTQQDIDEGGSQYALPRRLEPNEAVVDPQAWSPIDAGPYVHYALPRIGCEVEQLKLSWQDYLTSDLKSSDVLPTLVKSVAEVRYPSILHQPEIENADANELELLVPFLNTSELEPVSATELICGTTAPQGAWETCTPRAPAPLLQKEVSQRIVIISTFGPQDMHASPLGAHTPGGILVANYIESLLSGSYYRRANWVLALIISFVWFLLLEINWERNSDRPFYAALFAVGLSTTFLVGSFVVFARLFDQWLVLWPPGIVLISGKCLEIVIKRIGRSKPDEARSAV